MTTIAYARPEPLIRFGGSSVTEQLGGEQTGGACALIEFSVEPGYPVPPPHVHTHEDELSYVIEGELDVTVGDETRTVRAGEAIFKPRGIVHAFAVAGDRPVRFLEVILPAGFEGYFRAVAAMIRETGNVDRDAATQLMALHGLRMA